MTAAPATGSPGVLMITVRRPGRGPRCVPPRAGPIHAKDRSVAAWLQNTARAFAEVGKTDLAIDQAKQAADLDRGHQSLQAADYWCRLLEEHRPDEALDARLVVLPIHRRLVQNELVGDRRAALPARGPAAGGDAHARERVRAGPPRLQQELDRAGLP